MTVAIVPAAGKAERFGGGKLSPTSTASRCSIERCGSLLDGGADVVVVVLAPGATFATVERLNDQRVRRVVNPNPDRGMFSSIQIGLAVGGRRSDPRLAWGHSVRAASDRRGGACGSETHRRDRVAAVPATGAAIRSRSLDGFGTAFSKRNRRRP